MVIEFSANRNKIFNSKLKRFQELNSKYFMQNMSDDEVIEWNELEKWLKLHNN